MYTYNEYIMYKLHKSTKICKICIFWLQKKIFYKNFILQMFCKNFFLSRPNYCGILINKNENIINFFEIIDFDKHYKIYRFQGLFSRSKRNKPVEPRQK